MPKEKQWNRYQLKEKAARVRYWMSVLDKLSFRKKKPLLGTEMFLPTVLGDKRVLAYNMNNPRDLPLYINMHGGGFIMGDADMDDPFMAKIAEKANVKIFNVDYQLAPEAPHPKALYDCYAIAKYANEYPEDLRIDPDNIAIGGQSAGGNLSAAACLINRDLKQFNIKCLVMNYPPLDLYTDASLKPSPRGSIPVFLSRIFDACYCNEKDNRKDPSISPIFATDKQLRDFPPTLITTAAFDSLCEEGEEFRDRLMEVGVEVTHKRFRAKHGFNLKPGADADESWQMVIDHLKKHLFSEY
ncbi:MAG: alpha/beta hydrolase [Tannerella sp.]|jgi:acetyl esterase|nr:alpha/beta hydrolase [Tannerella sp.]